MKSLNRVVLFALLACPFSSASAHVSDGVAELFHGVRGGYELWVTDRPGTPVTGTHHLSVTVLNATDQAAVPDAEVHLTLASPNGDVSTYRATPGALGHFFEADAPLAQAGRWHLTLGVTSAQGREEVAFAWRVFTPFQLGLGLAAIVAALVAVLALLGFGRLDALRHLAGRRRWGQQVRSAERSLEYRRPNRGG